MSLKEENDKRLGKLSKKQKDILNHRLIIYRIGSFFVFNIFTIFTIGIIFGIAIWALAMIIFFDKFLIKWGLDKVESAD